VSLDWRRLDVLEGALGHQIHCVAGAEHQLTRSWPESRGSHSLPYWHMTAADPDVAAEYINAGVLYLTDPDQINRRILLPVDDDRVRELIKELES
jgi:hypothetical protein